MDDPFEMAREAYRKAAELSDDMFKVFRAIQDKQGNQYSDSLLPGPQEDVLFWDDFNDMLSRDSEFYDGDSRQPMVIEVYFPGNIPVRIYARTVYWEDGTGVVISGETSTYAVGVAPPRRAPEDRP